MTYTDLFTELVRAEIELWNSLEEKLRDDAGITLGQYQALSAVAKLNGSARVQDISQEMFITVGATSKLVDRLERDGQAMRTSNPTDRRSSVIALTQSGLKSLAAAGSVIESHLRSTLGGSYPESRASELAAELTALRMQITAGVTS